MGLFLYIFRKVDGSGIGLSAATVEGQALTLIPAEGILGAERTAIVTTAKRRDIASIKAMLFSSEPDVVITVQTAQQVKGAAMADTIK